MNLWTLYLWHLNVSICMEITLTISVGLKYPKTLTLMQIQVWLIDKCSDDPKKVNPRGFMRRGFNGVYWVKNYFFLNNLVLKQFLASNFIFPTKYIHIDSQIMISLIKLLNVYIEEGSMGIKSPLSAFLLI